MRLIRSIIRNRPLMYALFALYLAVLLRLTVLRDGLLPLHLLQGGANDLLPFAYYSRWLAKNPLNFLLREFLGNVVGFVPLGAFAYWRRPETGLSRVLLTGASASASIELLQYLLGVGRMSTGDLLFNTVGAVLGGALMRALLIDKKKDPDRKDPLC